MKVPPSSTILKHCMWSSSKTVKSLSHPLDVDVFNGCTLISPIDKILWNNQGSYKDFRIFTDGAFKLSESEFVIFQ